ncbi:MAG TPA: choice-of-anchor tandem repeat GloVer-containing protein [Rhizomicrobium sp.]|jgi:uncharacterized repeat protein (TIGR03803 family)|nr:choice-of-anchor tandem repeat GloVer-containing protein [Rhizomicrobium sp.]
MSNWKSSRRRYSLSWAVLFLLMAAPALGGAVYTDLFEFDCAKNGCNGGQPGLLAQGEDGILYGTLQSGTVKSAYGTVFDYTPGGAVSTLHRFQGDDGFSPQSGLSLGFDGAFYGTTTNGGPLRMGTVFKLSGGRVKVLYKFTDGADGAYPWAPPIQTPDGNLYGVTYTGTAYKIKPNGNFATIATLPSKSQAPLLMATDGNFYGTSQSGGTFNQGTVFRLSVKGKLTIIHNFDASTEGATPIGPVMEATDGKLYGTTAAGGSLSQGIVYQLTTNGAYDVLHNFQDTTEGSGSVSGLVQASDNYLYSVMPAGGANGYGTLYRINTTGTKFKVLHTFDSPTGAYPASTPTLYTDGTLYGLTLKGGTQENGANGVLFSFTNGFKPFVALQLWAGSVGTTVGILGQGFSAATGVNFGNVAATFNVVNDTYMTATVPAGATTAKVTVLETSGSLATLRKFKVL